MTRQGMWIEVEVPSDAAIINAGDTLQYITGGQIPSTTHQVVNTLYDKHRYSTPFFGNFPTDFPLQVLNHPSPSAITYGDFLNRRYKEIGIQ
jgi:isopenicillin N synthase-like dioxygenase